MAEGFERLAAQVERLLAALEAERAARAAAERQARGLGQRLEQALAGRRALEAEAAELRRRLEAAPDPAALEEARARLRALIARQGLEIDPEPGSWR